MIAEKYIHCSAIRPVLGVVLSWMIAHNILYTYVAPFLSLSGISSNVDVVLLVFGLAAMVGIFITGKVVDSALRMAVLLSLSVFTLVSIIFGISPTFPVVIYPGIAAWGSHVRRRGDITANSPGRYRR